MNEIYGSEEENKMRFTEFNKQYINKEDQKKSSQNIIKDIENSEDTDLTNNTLYQLIKEKIYPFFQDLNQSNNSEDKKFIDFLKEALNSRDEALKRKNAELNNKNQKLTNLTNQNQELHTYIHKLEEQNQELTNQNQELHIYIQELEEQNQEFFANTKHSSLNNFSIIMDNNQNIGNNEQNNPLIINGIQENNFQKMKKCIVGAIMNIGENLKTFCNI